MRYAIRCFRDDWYVRFINPVTGGCGWTPDKAEAMTWGDRAVAEEFAEGIGRVVEFEGATRFAEAVGLG